MAPERELYSTWTAFIYMFNLTLGTGALAIPSILSAAGWILGPLFLLVIAFLSFVAVSFVIESMASANALLCIHGEDEEERGETTPLVRHCERDIFRITTRVELGEMAIMFFPAVGQLFFYVVLVTYLYGSATIFATFVPVSMVRFLTGADVTHRFWEYDACLLLFAAVVVPFSMKDFQSTKKLQMVTMVVRTAALLVMIGIAALIAFEDPHRAREVPLFDLRGVPNLFGGAVYGFMCQHSLPGVIAPMREKTKELSVPSFAFSVISAIYLALFASTVAAFGLAVDSPITFNFSSHRFGWIGHVLVLFPVFTVSASYPMMCITLRNNLAILYALIAKHWRKRKSVREHKRRIVGQSHHGDEEHAAAPAGPDNEAVAHTHSQFRTSTDNNMLPPQARHPSFWLTLCTTLPPLFFASAAHRAGIHVDSLLGFTGGYSGCAVMFIIPAALAISSRRRVAMEVSEGNMLESERPHPKNTSAFLFKSGKWPKLLIAWAAVVLAFDSFTILYSPSQVFSP